MQHRQATRNCMSSDWWMSGISMMLKSLLRVRKVGMVLAGHSLTLDRTDEYIASYHDDFDALASAITRYEYWGFEFISMEELIALAQSNFRSIRNWIHLTFDDGYESVYTLAYPHLMEKQIPFSLFISTHHIETAERFYAYRIRCSMLNTKRQVRIPGLNQTLSANAPRQERIEFGDKVDRLFKRMSKSQAVDLMAYIDSLLSLREWECFDDLYREDRVLTVDQVQELADDELVHIGSHNHNHIVLNGSVSARDVLFEMQASRDWLRRNLGASVLTYSYPNGTRDDFSPTSRSICQRLGYELAFTAVSQFVSPKTDRYEIPRFGLSKSNCDFQRRLLKFFLPECVVNAVRLLKTVC